MSGEDMNDFGDEPVIRVETLEALGRFIGHVSGTPKSLPVVPTSAVFVPNKSNDDDNNTIGEISHLTTETAAHLDSDALAVLGQYINLHSHSGGGSQSRTRALGKLAHWGTGYDPHISPEQSEIQFGESEGSQDAPFALPECSGRPVEHLKATESSDSEIDQMRGREGCTTDIKRLFFFHESGSYNSDADVQQDCKASRYTTSGISTDVHITSKVQPIRLYPSTDQEEKKEYEEDAKSQDSFGISLLRSNLARAKVLANQTTSQRPKLDPGGAVLHVENTGHVHARLHDGLPIPAFEVSNGSKAGRSRKSNDPPSAFLAIESAISIEKADIPRETTLSLVPDRCADAVVSNGNRVNEAKVESTTYKERVAETLELDGKPTVLSNLSKTPNETGTYCKDVPHVNCSDAVAEVDNQNAAILGPDKKPMRRLSMKRVVAAKKKTKRRSAPDLSLDNTVSKTLDTTAFGPLVNSTLVSPKVMSCDVLPLEVHSDLGDGLDQIAFPSPLSFSTAGANQMNDLTGSVRDLYTMFMDTPSPSPVDLITFGNLIDLAFPFYDEKMPSAVDRARLQVKARKRGIPVELTVILLEAIQILSEKERDLNIEQRPSAFMKALSENERKQQFLQRLILVEETVIRRDVAIYTTPDSNAEEAVEVDLHGDFDFAANEYPESDALSDDAPWWEAAAKLVRESNRYKQKTDEISRSNPTVDLLQSALSSNSEESACKLDNATSSENPSVAERASVDEDIQGFWKWRKDICASQKKKGRKPLGISSSYASNTDNERSMGTKTCSYTTAASSDGRSDDGVWIRKQRYATWSKTKTQLNRLLSGNASATEFSVGDPVPINATSVLSILDNVLVKRRVRVPPTQQWKRPYKLRTKDHPGFFDVHVNSLYTSLAVRGRSHRLDVVPWEHRVVKQRFLFEQSTSYNKNWFGTTRKVCGNDTIKEPICRPKSMEMPMKTEVWSEEWYKKPWTNPLMNGSFESEDKEAKEMQEIRRKYNCEQVDHDETLVSWEETPECGHLRNVRLKIGERTSRVTPDLTCSLRKSRWRKKYFPKGKFPY
jgi:hypothetical protein